MSVLLPFCQRLPLDFEPFFAIGTRRPLDYREKKAKAQDGELSSVEEQEDSFIAGWSFQVIFVLFSSRLWDRLYLLLGLLWSVLCPGHLDNVMVVQRTQLGSILLVMFVTAVTPATMAVFLKVFFSAKLRSRLQDSRQFAVRLPVNQRRYCLGRLRQTYDDGNTAMSS